MTRHALPRIRAPESQPATGVPEESPGVVIRHGRRCDPRDVLRKTPERWMAFLHAFYRNPAHVAFEYNVTDRAARDWWEGRSAPRGSAVIVAATEHPAGFVKYLVVVK